MTRRPHLALVLTAAGDLWPALLPVIGAVGLLAVGQGVLDYHSALAVAPLSAVGAALLASGEALPGRPLRRWLVLALAPGQAISGSVTRDWLRPGVGGGK